MEKKIVKVGMIQTSSENDVDLNLKKTIQLTKQAIEKGAQIICLQELYRSDYFCQTEDYDKFLLAETIPGPSTEAFTKLAKEYKVSIVLPIFEKRTHGLYHNSIVMVDADGSLGIYRKMHIPDDPGFYEKFYFTPGDLGYKVFDTPVVRAGTLICWDQWYPEAARLTALKGAEILFYPTAIGWDKAEDHNLGLTQHDAWFTMQRSHSIANGVFVVSVNRIGTEGDITFWGQSFISDPFGNILYKASSDKEEVIVVDCDLSLIDHYRTRWPFLRDRRTDSFQEMTARYLD
ncbi:MAG: carbon-nitrogen hydrolase [Opitutaceae bacterium]|nr:carbon-nitrogen hydrolase [Cytophagales bacterium]